MAQVTIQKLVEGPAHLIVKINMRNDDGGPDLNLYPVIDPATMVPTPKQPVYLPALRIMQVWYGLVWFDVTVYTGTLTPFPLWTLARDCDSHTDFRSFGGLLEYPSEPPPGENGIISISTNGFNVLGSQGSMVIEFRKTNPYS